MHAASSLQKRTLLSKGGQTTYVKAVALRGLSDVKKMKDEIAEGHILIVRIAPIPQHSIEETKNAVKELKKFVLELGGDIARLGTERIVITPPAVKIWRGE